jgi:formylglycine-generating enzyme required for sulfatase activity
MKRALTAFALSLVVVACTTSTEDSPDTATGADGVQGGSNGGNNGGHAGKPGNGGGNGDNPTPPPPPAPRNDDGIKNGSETDVDCGGDAAPACADGKGCAVATDCTSLVCGTDHVCAAPTGTDGVKNGDESDVDCGGSTTGAPRCAVDQKCGAHADCASEACGYNGKCIAVKSCTAHHGGDTCGAGEDCCTTIDMPGAPGGDVKLDKYSITSGRFRQFVERENGNLRGYMQAHAPAWWDPSWTANLPTQLDSGGTTPDFTGVYQELGPYVHGTAQGANEGCYVNGIGARTYRLPDAVNARMGDQQSYSQDVLDEKPINCVSVYMIAAFCAWDGGKLPTRAQWNYAWGGATYPWGASPAPAGYNSAFDSDATGEPLSTPGGDVHRANYNYNFWFPATKVGTDYSLYIAKPGSFPSGNGPFGHADLAGGVFNFEEIIGTNANWSKSGSWQGHPIPYTNITIPATNKYWATGGRCAR